jgi:hypothetical protein
MDSKRKCAACDKVKQEAEFKQKRDGLNLNAVCKQCSENRKAARDRKKAELEGDSGKENTTPGPTVTEDENEEEERLRKELNKLTLEEFTNALMATEDVRSLTAFVDLSGLEVEDGREMSDKLAEAISEQLKYRFV